jgi:cell division septation protein DedD
MYDTRWPRPGPAMAAVAALLGLVVGTVLGLSSPGSAPQAEARDTPVETTVEPSTTTLPERFFTVVLGSFNDRARADARLELVRGRGVRDADLLDQEQYELGTRWAVYSGLFQSEDEAEAHMEQLRQLGIDELFVKTVRRVV